MRVGILGSGLMGGKVGTIFARAGHEVVFSYARSKDKLKRWRATLKATHAPALRPRRQRMQMRCCWQCIGRGLMTY